MRRFLPQTLLAIIILVASASQTQAQIRITEFMYGGTNGEFVEFTNIGSLPIDMTGWSYSDNSRHAGDVSLSAFGTVQPGESVILTETTASTFRTAWSLCGNIKIIGGNTIDNLGRNDMINLYDAGNNLIDSLHYGDQDSTGTIRTQNKSGIPSATALGKNIFSQWSFSAVGDAFGSYASTGATPDIGSPGKSPFATVVYDPCVTVNGAPTIAIDPTNTTDLLDGGISTAPASPFAVTGTLNDATDAATNDGIAFTIGDDVTPVANLTVTVVSSNITVVPDANLVLTGTGASRHLTIRPAAAGRSTITLTVNDGTLTKDYQIDYAASQSATGSTKWLTGIADASAAIALDDNYMVIANDESNELYIYNRNTSGLPVKTYDYNVGNILNLTDGSTGNWKELDVEAGTKSPGIPNRTYWLGSMSNSSSFNDKPNRNRLIAVDIAGTGAAAVLENKGYTDVLRQKLITWGDANGYDFTNSAKAGVDPKTIDGFNAEGMVFGPDNTTLYIGLRAPLVPTANRTKAVIAPITNFEVWFNNGAPTGDPTFGTPIELDLDHRGIRDLIRLSNGTFVIVAGSYDATPIPAIYTWTGNAADAPTYIPSFDLTGQNAEAAVQVNTAGQIALDQLQIISDDGDQVFYGDGTAAKDLSEDNLKKFSSAVVTAGGAVLPVEFEEFTAQRMSNGTIQLEWTTQLQSASFDIMRSTNGKDYTAIANTTQFTYTDQQAPDTRVYYRIRSNKETGRATYSTVRAIDAIGATAKVNIYPNPVTNGVVTIAAPTAGTKTVDIYNAIGARLQRVQFTGTVKDISTQSLAPGVYQFRITTGETTTTYPVMIAK